MSLKYCLTDDFVLIQITFRILNTKLHNFPVAKSSKQQPKHEKLYCVGFVHAGNSYVFTRECNETSIAGGEKALTRSLDFVNYFIYGNYNVS